jgi:UDP-4-amino-4-deoxy-L-arabinose-oxoglutarate aminotransferase
MKKREKPLSFCVPQIGDEEVLAVERVLRSGWITTGPETAAFEREIAALAGARHGIAVTSATAGLHILLLAMGIGPGDEVIVPSLTFACDANIVELIGAKPVFCDANPDTMLAEPRNFSSVLTSRTRAAIAVHFAGAPADIDGIRTVLGDIPLIEDAAHALGTTYKGIHAGGFGIPAFWSFHPIKNITTVEGGLVTTDDPNLDATLRKARFHGIDKDAWTRYGDRSSPGYDIEAPGFKYNFTDMQAAIGRAQLKKLSAFNARRAQIVAAYHAQLADEPLVRFQQSPGYPHVHSHHLAVVCVPNREKVVTRLRDDWNVNTGMHFPPCHELTYYRLKYGNPRLYGASEVGAAIMSLPLFPSMTDNDIQYVCHALKESLKG